MILVRDLSRILWLGGGEDDSRKNLGAKQRREKIFRSSRGRGHASPKKFEKIVQDCLKSNFWTLVTFTDSLISSSNKIRV